MAGPVRLLLTRPEAAARRFLKACEAAQGCPLPAILSPVMEITPVDVLLGDRPGGLILTSENGAARAGDLGLAGIPAWCVGARTAAVARSQGLDAVEAGPDAEALLKRLLQLAPSGPLLHLRGEHARGDLATRLRAAGLDAWECVAYRQAALPPTPEARRALGGAAPLLVPLFSPRSAALLAAWQPGAPLHVVALSEAVAEQAKRGLRPLTLDVAEAPNEGAMVAGTLGRLHRLDGTVA
jgi:uroporphyrinogen-III synthase